MKQDEEQALYDSDEEAVAHRQFLESEVKQTEQKIKVTKKAGEKLARDIKHAQHLYLYHDKKLSELYSVSDKFWRINSRSGVRKYATHCRQCGATYWMNSDAYQHVIDAVGTRGDTYRRERYKWFLWAKWDHQLYISHRKIDKCLNCEQKWSLSFNKEKRESASDKIGQLLNELFSKRPELVRLTKMQKKDERGARVLAQQSARKLHYKRQQRAAQLKQKAAEQAQAKLAQEMATKQRLQRESVALCLLKLNKPIQAIAQATGLSKAAITNLKSRDQKK